MAKLSLSDISNITGSESNAISTMNSNNEAIEAAIKNTLSRDGTSPNTMSADIDLNGNDLLNVGTLDTDTLKIEGTAVTTSTLAQAPFVSEGNWVTATSYSKFDFVDNNGSSYVCRVAHTSASESEPGTGGSWTTYWALIASKGDTGAVGPGSGDLLASNNFSDVTSPSTCRLNLGLVIGTDVQAYSDYLADIAGLSLVEGDLLFFNGTNIVKLAKGTAGQVLKMNSGATAPEWVSGGESHLQTPVYSENTADVSIGLATFSTTPLITQGTEIFSESLTPTSASSDIEVDVDLNMYPGGSATGFFTAVLFEDSTAIQVRRTFAYTGRGCSLRLFKRKASGSTSARTYSVRVANGGGGGTLNGTFNGNSCTMKISELG